MRISTAFSAAILVGALLIVAASGADAMAAKQTGVPLPDGNPKRAKRADVAKSPGEESGKAFDAAALLKPVLDFKLSKKNRDNLKDAISAVYKRRYPAAHAAMKRIKDAHARKLALWYYYRSRGLDAKAKDIEAFRVANPEWPSQERLRRNAERSLFIHGAEPEAVKAFFAESGPQTGAGKAALAAMHLKAGEKERARALIAEAWRDYNLNSEIETAILKRFSELLGEAEHKARVDRLLYQDRKSRIAAVSRTAKLLSKSEQEKIEARIAVVRRLRKAAKLLEAIPAEAANGDIGFYFSRIQWLRRHDKEDEAWRMLRFAPKEPALLLDLDEWWIERRVNCRAALNAGHPETAYEIASAHGPLTGESYAEAEFLSGWIALRFLGKTDLAQQHFLALRTAALSPRLIARGEYWLARTASTAGQEEEAKTHYANAAAHPFTYYGQLARQALSTAATASLPIAAPPVPTPEDVKRFLARDAVMAIATARSAGFGTLTPLFFHQLARTLNSAGEVVLLAELARAVEQPHASVRLGKIALNRGLPLAHYAYPVGLLPHYKKLNGAVEGALLHALSRQESEFNPSARSPVGARGLMQLMPRTARAVARQFKVRYRKSKLTGDPAYNMMLGVAHLADLLESYNGSYILTLVAYNAGGGRVQEWTEQFGDPRERNVDPIDWVERIPFTETRRYVQKILTGVQIFRSRLEGSDGALRLVQDLNRYEHPAEVAQKEAAEADADGAAVESQ